MNIILINVKKFLKIIYISKTSESLLLNNPTKDGKGDIKAYKLLTNNPKGNIGIKKTFLLNPLAACDKLQCVYLMR